MIMVEEHPVNTAEEAVAWIHRDGSQTGTVMKRKDLDAGDTIGNRDASHVSAVLERPFTYGNDRQKIYAVRYGYCPARTSVPDNSNGIVLSPVNEWHLRIPQHRRMTVKRWSPTGGSGQIIDYGQVAVEHIAATKTRRIPTTTDARQAGTETERPITNVGDAVPDSNVGQRLAVKECPIPDVGDAIGNQDIGHTGSVKGPVSNTGNGQADNCAGNHHHAVGTGVADDGDGPIISRVSELGLPSGGQRQQQRPKQAELNQVSLGFHDN